MSRKQIFANLAPPPAEPPAEGASGAPQESPAPRRPSRMRPLIGSPDLIDDGSRSPVGALGQSLGEMSERSRRAEEIEKKLTAGQTIVELDPGSVEPSFVPDRMPADDETFRGFLEAIRKEGQQVPILVRPHPENREKYQVAFGHRRLRAAHDLGIPVKAIVRSLTDQELVVAQGHVNAGARLHRFPEQRCINDADENALEHGLVWCASGWGRIVLGLVDVLAT